MDLEASAQEDDEELANRDDGNRERKRARAGGKTSSSADEPRRGEKHHHEPEHICRKRYTGDDARKHRLDPIVFDHRTDALEGIERIGIRIHEEELVDHINVRLGELGSDFLHVCIIDLGIVGDGLRRFERLLDSSHPGRDTQAMMPAA